MKSDSGKSISPWMKSVSFPQPKPMDKNLRAEIGVVGAGIVGVTIAYLLALEGKSVILLEDGPIAGGETSRTTAHLANVMDEGFFRLEKLHGTEGARLAVDSHTQAINKIESIIQTENIECGFKRVDGYLFADPSLFSADTPPEKTDILPSVLEEEKEAALRLGVKKVISVNKAPLNFHTGPCLKFPSQAQFHPLQYLHGLLKSFLQHGGLLFQAHVEKVEGGSPAFIHTRDGFTVVVDTVVMATNTPVNDCVVMHTKQAAYRTYVIGILVPKGSVTEALYWDTANPYHYIRLQEHSATHDLLMVGGEDHKTGQPPKNHDPYLSLQKWVQDRFPGIGQEREFEWSGQIMEAIDGLAYIGHNPWDKPNIYIATGDSGQGITHATIAGMLITDLIWGRENAWEKIYNPSRKTLGASWKFAQENTNVIAQYADWFMKENTVSSLEEIPQGSGAILKHGLSKTAVYHDKNNNFISLSAICPHLGGIVTWNEKEKTWDCPCHGSRFNFEGKVVNGPAINDLSPSLSPVKQKTA